MKPFLNPSQTTTLETELSSITREPIPRPLNEWPGFVLHWVARIGSDIYDAALAPLNLSKEHLMVLGLVEGNGPSTQAYLSEKLRIYPPHMVRFIDELEEQKLIVRRPHPTDRRANVIHLLAAGKVRIRQAEAVSREVTNRFFADLSPKEQKMLRGLLERLALSNAPLVPAPKSKNH
jgi:MarR family transcriptional regulator, lower aerobic nicotinate degradation pathway regulator